MPLLRSKDNQTADILRQVVRDYRYTAKPLNIERPQRPYNKKSIWTLRLDEDLDSGGTAMASVYNDDGTTDTGRDVTVVDTPAFISGDSKLVATTFLRAYRGDDGDYRILVASNCPVDIA
jgi:hypothetical protein